MNIRVITLRSSPAQRDKQASKAELSVSPSISGLDHSPSCSGGSVESVLDVTGSGTGCSLLSMDSDILTHFVFPFTSLADHFRLARCCKQLLVAGDVPSPLVVRQGAWNKHIRLPSGTSSFHLHQLLRFALVTSIDATNCAATIRDDDLVHLRGLPLQRLSLEKCIHITGAGLSHLKGLPLHYLNLRDCTKITQFAQLQGLPLLRHLNLWGCSISGDRLSHLQGMPALQHLDLSLSDIMDADLHHLQGLPLRHLTVSFCRNITNAGLVHLRGLPVYHLNLSGTNITDAGLVHMKGLPALQKLDLNLCTAVTDVGLVQHLQELNLQRVFI